MHTLTNGQGAAAADGSAGTTASGGPGGLRVAYLVNQYPKVSHSFIRREILALERQGIAVERYAVRGWSEDFPDPADRAERERTRYLLRDGVVELLYALSAMAVTRPLRLARALGLAAAMWRRSSRTLFHHLAYLAEACRLVQWTDAARVDHLHAHFGTNPAEVAMLACALVGHPTASPPTARRSSTARSPWVSARRVGARPSSWPSARSGAANCCAGCRRRTGKGQGRALRPRACFPSRRAGGSSCGVAPGVRRPPLRAEGAAAAGRGARRVVASGRPFELVLAGDGEMRAEIEARIDDLGLRANVRITGWIANDRVREEILAARALVLPSFAEGLPVVLMEAMALRRPVITTYVAGIPELVHGGESGWLVPAGDIDGLAEAMIDCLAAPLDVLGRMGEAAHAQVLARHDIDIEAAKLAGLFAASAASRAQPGETTAKASR
jgi:hypothetical protein